MSRPMTTASRQTESQEVVNGDATWTVENRDCMAGLRDLPNECVSLFLTDPPYGIDYQSARRTDKDQWKPKIANDETPFIWWLADAFRVCRDGAALLCFCRWDVQDAFRQAITWAGFDVKAQVIWDRVAHGTGDLTGCPAPQHDVIWFATNGRFTFPGRRPKSVVYAQRLPGEKLVHPNQKPLALIEELVRDYSSEGDLVVDSFTGSGTTLIACKRHGRRFIGFELSEEYAALATRRAKEDSPLFA